MSFGIAVSGMRAASADLDVTGNNIANANTSGFKSSRAEFADVYAASNLGVSRDAIGSGVALSRVAQQFTQGNITFTDRSLDIAINGDGFFVLEDDKGRSYTRAGAFGTDKDGYLVNATGQQLIGYQVEDGEIVGATGPLQLRVSSAAPRATSEIEIQVNLNVDAAVPTVTFDPTEPRSYNAATQLAIYDSLGAEHAATLYYAKTDVNTWDAHLAVEGEVIGTQELTFSDAGVLTSPTEAKELGDYDPGDSTGAANMPLVVDFTGSSQYGDQVDSHSTSQNGYPAGRLTGISIDEEGVVLARFSNGQAEPQGQVMLAKFANSQALQPLGNSAWAESSASGAPVAGAPGSGSLGALQSGALEESNVDLAQELVNMIVAQRNFQANAQVIRASDEVVQTIINIR
jgi:flagellar hook protein FlgE